MLTLTNGVRPETLAALLVDNGSAGVTLSVRLDGETDAVRVRLVRSDTVKVGDDLADLNWDNTVRRATVLEVTVLNGDRLLSLTTCDSVSIEARNVVALVLG